MGTEARTERARYLFKVSEYGDGTCWISTEPIRAEVPLLENALLGFDLPDGTSFKRSHEIADFLNNNLADVTVTIFDAHRMFRRK
jgi:hypothetical protein